MEDSISHLVKSFTEFLSKNKTAQKHQNTIFSFAVPCNLADLQAGFNLKNKIDYLLKHHETSFYFEKPSEEFLVFGFNDLLSIAENGDKRFTSTEKKVNSLKQNFCSNWKEFGVNFPLFLGTMKFKVEHSDDDWDDFNDSIWFIPEVILIKKNKNSFLLFNFYYNSSDKILSNKFKEKIENIFNIKNQTVNEKIKINSIQGNEPKDKKKWKNIVGEALNKIYQDEIKKVVIARRIEIQLSSELNFDYVIESFREKYPECYLFSIHKGKSTFFGATPEKLAKFSDNKIEIEALAGSAPRGKNSEEDIHIEKELLRNEKDLSEHSFVIEHIKDSLKNISKAINIQNSPTVKKLNNIQHLKTLIEAEINEKDVPFGILKELFPTPAVCGLPKDYSLQLIKKLENNNRGLYSGFIGWFNFENEGEFAVAIRSALTYKKKLIAYAGSGIVEKSEPDLEFEETELKLKPILSLLNEN